MKQNPFGTTGIQISELCLGTMTFGTQTSMDDAHAQIDMALDHGINILDTAEMYPVNPISKATQGDSERIIGEWVARSGRRADVLIATKVSGEGQRVVRNGAPISRATIAEAVEASLRLLQTEYIDLYQLHWPNRGSYMFRQNWTYDPTSQRLDETLAHMDETLEVIQELVDAGKVRHFGLSNESAWGTSRWLRMAEERGLPRVQAIQNEYSLLCRLFDTDLAELCHNEQVGLLAFSPLATGLLTGKYQGGAVPEGSRRTLNSSLGGRATPRVWPAVDAYLGVAREFGLDPVHMALAWCRTRPFVASSIFGATRLDQLAHLLGVVDVDLSDECLTEIDRVHRDHPMPY
ncbi:MAG: aldo/keto reductase [Paracoccaceae bacterium]|nr:aldo/keto reductase [Paracoccaceae bacterium]MDE2911691.1 aldo/keto reductase [Paracoccaceae bacterium]